MGVWKRSLIVHGIGGVLSITFLFTSLAVAQSQEASPPAPPARTRAPQPQTPPSQPPQPAAVAPKPPTILVEQDRPVPPSVVTVVQRLSGWKLRASLALVGQEVDSTLFDRFVSTRVVAGYVLEDRSSIVTRLPEAEAEMLAFPTAFFNASPRSQQSELLVIGNDSKPTPASFVGLDSHTWLSLLRIPGAQFHPSREAEEESLFTGQRLRLYAPQPIPGVHFQKPQIDGRSVVRVRIGEIAGTLGDIKRGPSGELLSLTVRSQSLTPAVVGAVAFNEANEAVGIVESSDRTEARVLPVSVVKQAAKAMLERKGSIPRPLLGVRGTALSGVAISELEAAGWKVAEAEKLKLKGQGIVLNFVLPGTPAARANMRPGDIIVRVDNDDIRTEEDLSVLLREAAERVAVSFTVLRAEDGQLTVTTRLGETVNPATVWSYALGRSVRVAGLEGIVLPRRVVNSVPLAPIKVVSVIPGSTAQAIGLRPGDVIETVNGERVTSEQLRLRLTPEAKPREISIVVLRGTERVTLTGEIKKSD